MDVVPAWGFVAAVKLVCTALGSTVPLAVPHVTVSSLAGPDPLSFRANPGGLVSKAADAPEGEGDVYRAPRHAAVTMDDDSAARSQQLRKEQRQQRHALARAQNSEYLREVEAELTGAPSEVRETGAFADSISALKSKQRMEARARQEEDLMVRPLLFWGIFWCRGLHHS